MAQVAQIHELRELPQNDDEFESLSEIVGADAELLSQQLIELRRRAFPPSSSKTMRTFTSSEVARLIGVSDAYIRHLSVASEENVEKTPAGRRLFTLEQVHDIRRGMSSKKAVYVPTRRGNEKLQVIAITNFKGGSGKTTTAAHLSQHFAMRGYRTLAIDLDPQASLSALFGLQPEVDVGDRETIYGAICYGEERRPLSEIIRRTYVAGLDVVPAHLELQEFEHETPKAMMDRSLSSEGLFYARIHTAIQSVKDDYDIVIIDCPPALGFLTLSALCASSSVLVTVHPQMLDVASMSQFLALASALMQAVERAGANTSYNFFRYMITRFEPTDGPQAQIVGLMRSLFGNRVLTHAMLKSTAISDAGLTKQTLYEVKRESFTRSTYDRAIESLENVNREIEGLVNKAWRRPVQ